ncbi:BTAD domain-containing putative transcriptional regulator [Pararoseomonas indoligenes]|uniref:Bacterial transcriptional activator domain-containing protein n=1 Tax=Roseomonas indoligenes TaxID=2820811 RepID=A0A940S4B8_9PROT|nr:BTAD domain-containing putative transcriptional regulator [Pararoseomonas indoligenes]MBP0491819.1 hypothetical protein [Pararoseomonas indoligenes]
MIEPQAWARITLLGPVRACDAAGHDLPLRTRKGRALLGHLLLARGRPVSRLRLATLLWERSGEIEARASLRQALAEVVRALQGAPAPILVVDRESIRADAACCEVDALALLDGQMPLEWPVAPLMDGLEDIGEGFGEWLIGQREAVRFRLRDLLGEEADRLAADPDKQAEAVELARRAVESDVADEAGWRRLIRLHLAAGDRALALQTYERCCDALRRSLDVAPSPKTKELAERIRTQRLASSAPSPNLPSLALSQPIAAAPSDDQPLRVGVVPAQFQGGREPDAITTAYVGDVALELARYHHFDVISPMGLGPWLAEQPDAEALRALNLDYVVNVSIRGPELDRHLLVSLVDIAELARPLWSARAPLRPDAAGEVQSDVLHGLVARLEPVILHTEGTRPISRHATGTAATVLRAIPRLFSMEASRFMEAGQLLAEAVTRSPENAMAAAWAAHWHVFQIGQGWATDPRAALEEAERLATLAMSLDPENAEGLAIYGHVNSFLHKDFASAKHYFAQSLELNPHQAFAWAMSGATHVYSGDLTEAMRRMERYRTLAPFHPHDRILRHTFTAAHLLAGRFEEAVMIGRRSVRASPGFVNGYKHVLAALGHLGMRREAKPLLERLLTHESDFKVQNFVESYPFNRIEDREIYEAGLRLAGAK